MSLRHYMRLSLASGLGPVLIRRLLDAAGSAEAAVHAPPSLLLRVEGIGQARAAAIGEALRRAEAEVEEQLRTAERIGAKVIAIDDADYPPLLKLIHDPPIVLYAMGSIEPRDLQAIAIVGSRKCSIYGREQAERFAGLLSSAGFTVVSGGARGVDSAAHRGAMLHPAGRTIAVLGSGLDVPYPSENAPLFRQIAERGALISEFPFGTPPVADNFPRRNRVISGLSRGVLVVEADIRSGALITARLANEDHGRAVFAVPGRLDNAMSAGPHQLIRDGAALVTGLEDILEGLTPLPEEVKEQSPDRVPAEPMPFGPAMTLSAEPAALPPLTGNQRRIVDALDDQPTGIEQLIERTNLDAGTILRELTFMTLKGAVKRVDGQAYQKARS